MPRTVLHDAAMSGTASLCLAHPLVPGQFLISLVPFLLASISDPLSDFVLCLAIVSFILTPDAVPEMTLGTFLGYSLWFAHGLWLTAHLTSLVLRLFL